MFYPFFFYSWLIVSVVHLSKATLVMSCYMFFFKSLVKTFCSALIMSCFLFYWCLFCRSFFQSSECLAYLKHVCLMEQNGRLKNFLFTTALAESLRFWYASFLFSFSSKNFLISLLFFFLEDSFIESWVFFPPKDRCMFLQLALDTNHLEPHFVFYFVVLL